MRKPIIAGNWKMHKTVPEAVSFVDKLSQYTLPKEIEIVICAPFLILQALTQHTVGSHIRIGAQNVHWEIDGAYTGEVSVPMLRDLGVEYVIIGHSERRQYFAESDETVNWKTKAVLTGGLTPIVCVGEQLEERENGQTIDVIQQQVKRGLDGLTAEEVQKVVIAYEPVWAIGTGKASSAEQAQEVCQLIRQTVMALWDQETADALRVQYGGSVKPENIATYLAQPDIDGALVGGASLKPESMFAMVQAVSGENV